MKHPVLVIFLLTEKLKNPLMFNKFSKTPIFFKN